MLIVAAMAVMATPIPSASALAQPSHDSITGTAVHLTKRASMDKYVERIVKRKAKKKALGYVFKNKYIRRMAVALANSVAKALKLPI